MRGLVVAVRDEDSLAVEVGGDHQSSQPETRTYLAHPLVPVIAAVPMNTHA
jgi:hypothetical protein